MRNSRWQPTLLVARHRAASAGRDRRHRRTGQWRWALGVVLANHLLLMLVGLWAAQPLAGAELDAASRCRCARNEIA